MKKHIGYWATTGLFALMLTMSGLMALMHNPAVAPNYLRLGYPAYFMTLLGAAKLAGVAALLAPRLPRLKEWAYAGFAINLVSAVFSHAAMGDAASSLTMPVVLFGLLMASWWLRPADRVVGVIAGKRAGILRGREVLAS